MVNSRSMNRNETLKILLGDMVTIDLRWKKNTELWMIARLKRNGAGLEGLLNIYTGLESP